MVEPDAELSPSGPPGRLDAYLERVAPEVLGITCWFEPTPATTGPVTVRLSGWRLDVTGPQGPKDRFTHDEIVEDVVAGAGPVAVTAKVRDLNAEEWAVNAELLVPPDCGKGSPSAGRRSPQVHRASWSWRRWRLSAAPATPVHTCPSPYARAPGELLGAWAVLAVAGVVVALVAQTLTIAASGAHLHRSLPVSLAAIAAGIVGAKVWFMVQHRHDRRREGWCIQGLVTGVTVVAVTLAALARTPIGAFLDVSAPALMLGMAVGGVGCFFTGCCAGRPTASRWGVWSSDRRVGMRRIPTQLLESALAGPSQPQPSPSSWPPVPTMGRSS